MRNRDTVRVRIAGHQTWIDPAVLTQALARQRTKHTQHETYQSWCIACQREAKQELADKHRQEGAMDPDKVTAWSDEAGLLLCRDCADDAKAGGARLTQTRVIKGRLCACGQEIGKQ